MTDDHKFEKDLAIIQLKATVAATLGAILLSLGSAIIIFSYSITSGPSNPDSSVHYHYVYGLIMIAGGIGILFGSLSKKVGEIRKLP